MRRCHVRSRSLRIPCAGVRTRGDRALTDGSGHFGACTRVEAAERSRWIQRRGDRLGWNGAWREIELSKRNRAALSRSLDRHWKSARPVAGARHSNRRLQRVAQRRLVRPGHQARPQGDPRLGDRACHPGAGQRSNPRRRGTAVHAGANPLVAVGLSARESGSTTSSTRTWRYVRGGSGRRCRGHLSVFLVQAVAAGGESGPLGARRPSRASSSAGSRRL
jgi:hypothetical protein